MAAGKINLQKASGGVTAITGVDGIGNTEVTVPESGELVTKEYADLKVALASFTGANVNVNGAAGYQKLPSGLIIQWGSHVAVTNGGGGSGVVYPIAFPSVGFQPIICNGDNNIGLHFLGVIASQVGRTGFGWVSSLANIEQRVNWISIGY